MLDVYNIYDERPSSPRSPWMDIDEFEWGRFEKIWPRFYRDATRKGATPERLQAKYALSFDAVEYLITVVRHKNATENYTCRDGGMARLKQREATA